MSAQLERVEVRCGEQPVDGDELVNDTRSFIERFCVFPDDHCLTAVTLWAVHAHMVEHFHTTPRLALLSPDPASGKTRVLEVLDLLVPESLFSLSASPAAIFRSLAHEQITLLFDEVDAIWNKRGKDDNHEDLRSLLNAGYKRGASIPRCERPKHEVTRFDVYCAVALAGLGEMPDTIMSRSIIIRMRRRAPSENIEPFRTRRHAAIGNALRDRLAQWAETEGPEAGEAWPEMPEGIVDRNEEIWEPLLAVADAAGGDWPKRARCACVAMCKAAEDRRVSLGIRLLGDLKKLFRNAGDPDAMPSALLLELLAGEESGLDADAPWGDLYGKAINPRKLASLLKPYGIKSQKIKVDGKSLQGYRRESFWDAWERYVPILVPAKVEPMEPTERLGRNSANYNGSGVPEEAPHAAPSMEPFDAETEPFAAEKEHLRGGVPQVPEVPDSRTQESAVPQSDEEARL